MFRWSGIPTQNSEPNRTQNSNELIHHLQLSLSISQCRMIEEWSSNPKSLPRNLKFEVKMFKFSSYLVLFQVKTSESTNTEIRIREHKIFFKAEPIFSWKAIQSWVFVYSNLKTEIESERQIKINDLSSFLQFFTEQLTANSLQLTVTFRRLLYKLCTGKANELDRTVRDGEAVLTHKFLNFSRSWREKSPRFHRTIRCFTRSKS